MRLFIKHHNLSCQKLYLAVKHGSQKCLYFLPSVNNTDEFLKPRIVKRIHQLQFCSVRSKNEELLVQSYGEPKDVIIKKSVSLPTKLEKNQVLTRVLASPINPADINTIQGVYAIKPGFPFVPGNEAVMEVVETGSEVTSLKEGDHVIPKHNAMGTWRNVIVAHENRVIKIPSNIDVVTAATIAINPCTAYRMLTDFVPLKEGDVIIQNCANSAVGQAAIQIAASKGLRTINIVRERPNFESLQEFLLSLGATMVISDTELRKSKAAQDLPKPVLALNGVSGKSATELLRNLAEGGTMVTYGGMSRQPVTVGVGALIFNDVSLRGFWMTRWSKLHENHPERKAMLDFLFGLYKEGKLRPPDHEIVSFQDYKRALENAMPAEGKVGKKQILVFD